MGELARVPPSVRAAIASCVETGDAELTHLFADAAHPHTKTILLNVADDPVLLVLLNDNTVDLAKLANALGMAKRRSVHNGYISLIR